MKDLLPILRHAFPHVKHYEVLGTVVQDNAKGYHLLLTIGPPHDKTIDEQNETVGSKDDDDNDVNVMTTTQQVFVKDVDAEQYAHTKASWPDFRRTLMYLRTEVRFYKEIVPQLDRGRRLGEEGTKDDCGSLSAQLVPKIYYADYDLDGLIGEDEYSTDQCVPEPTGWSAKGKGGSIIMEYIGLPYMQTSPITMDQAKQTLTAIAGLHASAWEDVELLKKANERLSRGSYHLKTRNVKELAGMVQAWEKFSSNFQHLDVELFRRTDKMGHRVQRMAEYISEQVSPTPTCSYATLSRGDFKSMNCFLSSSDHRGNDDGPSGSNHRDILLVDFASVGVGLGMSDVAMHIHHALLPEDLADGGEDILFDHYLKELNALLGQSGRCYPRDVALRHHRLAMVDYFRFFLGRFWKSSTPETFTQKMGSKNTALINRNLASAFAFLDRADRYL